ncbi:MAG: divalent metal cation transporter [Streptosporangiales bacterium]|nr:divalent metal cation transporter [Streptosporangiales bacterium]
MVAGGRFGYTFVWAFVFAAVLKYFLTEALGRWHLATGRTIIEGWRAIGLWAVVFVGVYLVLWAFIYGAAGPATVGLAANAMVPALSVEAWAIVHSLAAFAIVLIGRYGVFELIMKVLVGVMFVTVVGSAVIVGPDLAGFARGLVPTIPAGSLLYAVGVVGGLGGTLALAAYGYWIRDKNWHGRSFIPLMRLDSVIGYVATAIFALSMLVLGAEFLYGTDRSVEGDAGLLALVEPLAQEHGVALKWLFLLGFWSVAYTSVLGVWNGMSYLFADIVRTISDRTAKSDTPEGERPNFERTRSYRLFLVMLTFPTIPLILLGRPVQLVLIWVTLGAIFLPFLACTLLYLLNARRFGVRQGGIVSVSNIVLALSLLVFAVLLAQQVVGLF